MPRRFMQGLHGLVPSFLRRGPLPLLTIWSLILALPAHAGDKESKEDRPPVATIVDVAIENGALTARILWTERTGDLPDKVKVVTYSGKGDVLESAETRPMPGRTTEMKLFKSLESPWDTHWRLKLRLEHDEAVLASQPLAVTLDCKGEDDECELVVSPGLETTPRVVQVSEDLDEALTLLGKESPDNFDMVKQVSEKFPELRGEALVLAHQVSGHPGQPGGCNCTWVSTPSYQPVGAGRSLHATARLSERSGWSGPGAKHWMNAHAKGKFLSSVHGIEGTESGSTQVKLDLACRKTLYTIDKYVRILLPDGTTYVLHIVHSVDGPCSPGCTPRFDHQGRITGVTSVGGEHRPGNRANAHQTGRYSVDGTTLMEFTATQGESFDRIATHTTSGFSTTGRVDSTGYVFVRGRWKSASAYVANGHAVSIHGEAPCLPDPDKESAAIMPPGTLRGIEHEESLRQTIKDFFWQWYIPVYP
ncbi:hypothetical protein [Myxococcus faecalis]|uniref:hypothetical protein n=1 Tax=Myxococcus faecalis TaxID=3115646 RepID=UPI003CE80879